MKRPRKVVFPLAAPGVRATGESMNGRVEMMPIVDKPMIQYATEEALAAGFDELVFVTGRGAQLGPLHQVGYFAERMRADGEWTELGPVGRAIFTPALMRQVEKLCTGGAANVRIRDAVAQLLRHETVLAWSIEGDHYDCST